MDFIIEQNALLPKRCDRRTDRLERVVKLAIRAGARERREGRERYNALIGAQMRTEENHRRMEENLLRTEELTRRNSIEIARESADIRQLQILCVLCGESKRRQ
jgi:hypothetical protein